ncbi:MAG: alpha/beta fold hydrolase [Gammaproteobacteria bacterium]|nr:alpha/beta fold hydrolase [Gammaproteobacteria bacterium]
MWRHGRTTLYRYGERPPAGPPLVIVYSLVNRPYILDLESDRSIIAALLGAGVPVYLLEWGAPGAADRFTTLDDYLFDDLEGAVEWIVRGPGARTASTCSACARAACSRCATRRPRPGRVANLVTMVTPVDFHTPDNMLARWVRSLDVEELVSTLGNVPGELLNFGFLSLKPFALGAGKYMEMIDHADDAERLATFLRMEKWIHDSPDQAGAAFAEFVRAFFVDNRLVDGTLEIGGHPVSLAAVTQPVLNVIAARDHLVPPSASRPLGELIGSNDYRLHEVDAGHIGLFVGRETSVTVAATIAGWLAERH